jgi:hypothetical protein
VADADVPHFAGTGRRLLERADNGADDREGNERRDPWHASRYGLVLNPVTASVAELREVMQARRRPHDPVSVALGRCAQSLTAAGEVDAEIALSYVLFPTPELLEAVAAAAGVTGVCTIRSERTLQTTATA